MFGLFKRDWCPVTFERWDDTKTLALATIDFLNKNPELEWWADFGSLLAVSCLC